VIFASDLDQTLIYSETSMGSLKPQEEIVPIEWYDGRYISFMTQNSIRILSKINSSIHFIPVTTRTVEQYERISIFRDVIQPKYAITSNGGTILTDGRADELWQRLVTKSISQTSAPAEEIKKYFDEIASSEWLLKEKYSDNLFYSLVVERDKLPMDVLEQFRILISKLGWGLSVQGRKIYLVPHSVSKGDAMLHLKERLDAPFVTAAGDSLLDESLLVAADEAVAPRHGELFKHYQTHPHIVFTQSSGIYASEELLERVLQYADGTISYTQERKEGVI
jgi:hydroxymethylpyrimidine pyrophosphatase-like HAD family hydrolase